MIHTTQVDDTDVNEVEVREQRGSAVFLGHARLTLLVVVSVVGCELVTCNLPSLFQWDSECVTRTNTNVDRPPLPGNLEPSAGALGLKQFQVV
jgi:hypothetical protein